MIRRLKIYFIHSNKYDYVNLIYKPLLQNKECIVHDLLLPLSDKYKNKYVKDLINESDIIIAEISKPNFYLKLEIKWALKTNKPILFYSLTNEIPKSLKKYVKEISKVNDDLTSITLITNFINKYANMTLAQQNDKTVTLGNLN